MSKWLRNLGTSDGCRCGLISLFETKLEPYGPFLSNVLVQQRKEQCENYPTENQM